MAFRHGFKTSANRIALEIRANLGLAPTSPLDPWTVCGHYDVTVLKLSSLVGDDGRAVGYHFLAIDREAFSAVVFPCGIRAAIVHNDSHAPVRQRSNLFHELAHLFLGHPLKPLLSADGTRDRNSVIEEEAAFLGGCLLIPNEAACHIVNSRRQATAASTYGVSDVMLMYRLRVSGATQIAARRANKRLAG